MKIAELEKIQQSYKKIGGTHFKNKTSDKVAEILNELMMSNERVRLFYGNPKTGKDFCKRYDTIGYLNRCVGEINTLVLLKDKRSFEGVGIMDDCIVKVMVKKKIIYQHPNYRIDLSVKETDGYFCLYKDNKQEPIFRSKSRRETGREEQIYLGNREK